MKSDSGALSFEVLMETYSAEASLAAMERRIKGFTNNTIRETSRIDTSLQNLGKLAAGAFVFSRLAELPSELLKVRSEFQALEISFTTMLRSKSEANALLADVTKFAAATPFGLKETANGAKQLLAYGFAAKELIPTLTRLGNVSAGLGLPLERLTYLYGTTKTQGRLFAQDLNQFVGSGIPLIGELAKQFGVAEDGVRKLVEDGKVGFAEVKKAIEAMTTGSGLFAGTLEAQSKSLNALRERLGDAYDRMLNDIGKKNEGIATDLFNAATTAIEHYQDVIDTIEVLAASYGGYRAALVVSSIAQSGNIAITAAQAIAQAQAANATGFLTISQTKAAASTALLSRAQAVLNSVMSVNPIVLIGTALAALTTAYFVFKDEVRELHTAQDLLSRSTGDTNTKFATQKAEVTSLVSVLKNQNVAESQRLQAYQKLNEISPSILQGLDFQKSKTADLTKTLNEYLDSLKKKIRLESGQDAFKDAFKQELDAAQKTKDVQKELNDLAEQANKQAKGARRVSVDGSAGAANAALATQIQQKKNELKEAIKAEQDAKKITADVEKSLNEGLAQGSKEALEATIAYEQQRLSLLGKTEYGYKLAEDSLKKHQEALAKLNNTPTAELSFSERLAKAEDAGSLRAVKAFANTENKLEELQKKVKAKLGDAINGSREKAQFDQLNKDISYALGKRTKEQKEAEKVGPYGSISYWERIVQLANEAIDKTPKTNTAGIEKQKQIIINAEKELEDIRKQTAIRSFDEEIIYKRSQFELYQKWAEQYGQASADAQFGELKKSGQSYLDYLNAQIATLEAKRTTDKPLSDKDALSLSLLQDQRNTVTAKKSAIDVFKDSLQQARASAASLADYLDILKQKQADLETKPNTQEYLELRQQVATDIVETQQQLSRELTGYLQNVTGAEEQRLAVTKKYADLRLALEQRYKDKIKDAAFNDTKAKIDKGEKDEIKEINERATQASDAYKKLDEVILSSGRKAQRERLALLDDYLKKEVAAANTQAYQIKKKERNDLVIKLSEEDLGRLSEYGQLLGQFGSSLTSLGGDAAKSGEALISLSSTIGLVAEPFKKGVDKSQLYANAISGLVTLFSAITDAAAKRKQAESEYYASVIAQQQQYNLLLNEQLAIRSKNSNPFIDDYTGQLVDSFEAQRKAQEKLDESLKKLNEGRAKGGQKNILDNASALKLIGAGAGTGAAIGAIAGPAGAVIGALVGTAVGALTSLFGGATKKADEFGALLERYPDLIQKSADGTSKINVALAQSLIDTGRLDDKTKALVQTTLEWQKQVDATKQAIQDIVKGLVGQLGDKLRDSLVGAFKDGEDAAKAFSGVLNEVIEDFVTKLLYSQIFTPYFKKLGEDITKSLDTDNGGDGNIIDDLERSQEQLNRSQEAYFKGLQQWKDYAESKGFDILKATSVSGTKNPNSMSGVIQSQITEATANVLTGQINAMRITSANTEALVRQQLLSLSGIEQNTARIQRTNELLDSMDRRLKQLNENSGRGLGQPG